MFFLISDSIFINDKKKKLFILNLKLNGFPIWATPCCWNWPSIIQSDAIIPDFTNFSYSYMPANYGSNGETEAH